MLIPENNLVSVDWLQKHLVHNKLLVLYTHMADPVSKHIDIKPEKFIPHSVLFDFENTFCDPTSLLPHTMPNADLFTQEARKLGINKDSVIIVYDAVGVYCAPRVWWMFKSMGHKHVFVLDGGLPQWLNHDFPTDSKLTIPNVIGNFSANYIVEYFVDADDIIQNNLHLIDARSTGRFKGTSPEPRKGLRSGHAPGAINLPFEMCLEQGRMKSKSKLKTLFSSLPVSTQPSLVFSCGSGVTACILALGASEAGYQGVAVYDGSWSEWGGRTDLPVIGELPVR